MEDTFHYWAHRALHWGPLYKNIHKIHHQYSAPFGLAAEYAHPAEVFILGLGTVGSPILYCAITRNLHLITMYVWITLRYFPSLFVCFWVVVNCVGYFKPLMPILDMIFLGH